MKLDTQNQELLFTIADLIAYYGKEATLEEVLENEKCIGNAIEND